MTDEKKSALQAVKAAERAWESAAKKASASREKYLELQRDANAAARALAHARTNPALFDDDPTSVVLPSDMPPAPPTPKLAVVEDAGDTPPEPEPWQDADIDADTPPWEEPVAAPEPEAKPRTRRVGQRRTKVEPPTPEPLSAPEPIATPAYAPDGTIIDETFDQPF